MRITIRWYQKWRKLGFLGVAASVEFVKFVSFCVKQIQRKPQAEGCLARTSYLPCAAAVKNYDTAEHIVKGKELLGIWLVLEGMKLNVEIPSLCCPQDSEAGFKSVKTPRTPVMTLLDDDTTTPPIILPRSLGILLGWPRAGAGFQIGRSFLRKISPSESEKLLSRLRMLELSLDMKGWRGEREESSRGDWRKSRDG